MSDNRVTLDLLTNWADYLEGSFDAYLRYSDDFGENWSGRIWINPSVAGDQWNPDMDIDSQGALHIVYYSEESGYYQPWYRVLDLSGSKRDIVSWTSPIVISDASTSSSFTRSGEYFVIHLDGRDIPHVVWSNGRNEEMDIYYAHGLIETQVTTITTEQPGPLDLLIAIGVTLIAAACVVIVVSLQHRARAATSSQHEQPM